MTSAYSDKTNTEEKENAHKLWDNKKENVIQAKVA